MSTGSSFMPPVSIGGRCAAAICAATHESTASRHLSPLRASLSRRCLNVASSGTASPHEEAEEEVAAEPGDVGVVAPAVRLDADEAPDYGRSRVARVACGGKENVPKRHPAVAVEKLFYEGKAAVRVDFFGTLDKVIHDNLVG